MQTLLLSLIVAACGLAQTTPKIEVIVTYASGAKEYAKTSGVPAAQGLDVLEQLRLTQCDQSSSGACVPRFANVADLLKDLLLKATEEASLRFPSAAMKAEVDAAEAAKNAVAAKRKALFDAARAEK